MKKCFYFPTWEEQKDGDDIILVKKNRSYIFIPSYANIDYDGYFNFNGRIFYESTPSDPILAKLCELTGAKMYENYIVLDCLNHISDDFGFYTIKNGKLDCIINTLNIFKQYSLFLQGKENKWEEAKDFFGI